MWSMFEDRLFSMTFFSFSLSLSFPLFLFLSSVGVCHLAILRDIAKCTMTDKLDSVSDEIF